MLETSPNTHFNTTTKCYSDSYILISFPLFSQLSQASVSFAPSQSSLSQNYGEENRIEMLKSSNFLNTKSYNGLKSDVQALHRHFSRNVCCARIKRYHYLDDVIKWNMSVVSLAPHVQMSKSLSTLLKNQTEKLVSSYHTLHFSQQWGLELHRQEGIIPYATRGMSLILYFLTE